MWFERRLIIARRLFLGNIVVIVPLVIGTLVLLVAVGSIWSLLSLDAELDQEPTIGVRADCEGYLMTLDVDPWHFPEGPDSVDLEIGNLVEIEISQLPFEECSYFVVDLLSDNVNEARVVATDPTELDYTFDIQERPIEQVMAPIMAETVSEVLSERIAELGIDELPPPLEFESYRITLSNSDPYLDRLKFDVFWPDMYQFSHVRHGAMASLLGPYLSKFSVSVHAVNEASPEDLVDVDLTVYFSTRDDFEIQETGGFETHDSGKRAVSWSTDGELLSSEDETSSGEPKEFPTTANELFGPLGLLRAEAELKHIAFESKTNLILIGGGAAIGLGLTLVAESFLVFLFRIERGFSRRRRVKRRRQPD